MSEGKLLFKNFTDKEKVEKISFLSLRKKSRKIKFSLGKKNSGKYRLFLEGRKMYIYYVYIFGFPPHGVTGVGEGRA